MKGPRHFTSYSDFVIGASYLSKMHFIGVLIVSIAKIESEKIQNSNIGVSGLPILLSVWAELVPF